ncbi:MAG: HD domain-containing protein [Ruminococcus sp.]|nr:HD domain-containing protein [Ruminococcus sp.]
MISLFYEISFLASLVLLAIYSFIYHKRFDVHITLIFVLVPVCNLGYVLLSHSTSINEAVAVNKLTYIGACYLMLLITETVFSLCDIHLNRWIRAVMYILSSIVYISVLTDDRMGIFYKSITFERVKDTVILTKEYAFMRYAMSALVIVYFSMSIGAMVYSYFRKNQVPRSIIYLLFLPVALSMFSFFVMRKIIPEVEFLPASYTLALVVYLIIISRLSIYDVSNTAADSLIETETTAFVSFDFKMRYLGSNDMAKKIFPELTKLTVDKPIPLTELMQNTVLRWLKRFRSDDTKNSTYYQKDGNIYLITISYLYVGHYKKGYQFFITDDTRNQKYIRLMNRFNTELKTEVEQKTAHIIEMHDNLILSMATMVESRDNSTGGHIKRTSVGVRMLIEQMRVDPENNLSEKFCRDIIKAAPMHDLGKIAVDDAVLRKPGRFTPEEYEKMKVHAAEGARIVHEILKGTDDLEFHIIAENVAHYHHERYDGSGYPDGLKGEEIPLEARIMAIADVYDALVSKRVYKEKIPFDKADQIIMEGMGTQFDKSLERYYVAARPHLEKYYASLDN